MVNDETVAQFCLMPNDDVSNKHGIKLKNYYTLCICSASRGVILTGRYDIFNGLQGIATQGSKRGVSLQIKLISDYLANRPYNYSNYFIGKWHIGKYDWKQTPTHRGFKYFYGMLGGASDYFTHITGQKKYDWHEHIGFNCNNTDCARLVIENYNKYSTTLSSSKAIQIIKNSS